MNEKITERKLRRLFPNHPESFFKRNQDILDSTGVSSKSESVDRKKICKAQRDKEVGKEYQLCHIDVVFYAQHGKKLDEDNRRYIVKPIQDACVNLGLAQDDSHITSEATQRLDSNNPYI